MYYIYLIVNKVNFKTYVGQRKSNKKWNEDSYMGSGKLLKLAQKKYGIENFEKFLIQYCSTKEEVNEAEKFWIKEYRSRGKAQYNIADGGQGGNLGEEVIKKRAETLRGRHHSEEHKRKISEAKKGKHHPHSEETKKKISEAVKGKKRKPHSDETKKKLSEAHKGKHHSEETRKKMSKPRSEEIRKKISETLRGKPKSEESRKKMSEARKGMHWKLVDGKRVWY